MADPHYDDQAIQDALRDIAKRLGHVPSIQEYEKMREKVLFAWMDESQANMRAYCEGDANPFPLPSVMTIRSRYPKEKGGWEAAVAELRKEFPPQQPQGDLSFIGRLIGRVRASRHGGGVREASPRGGAQRAPGGDPEALLRGSWDAVLESREHQGAPLPTVGRGANSSRWSFNSVRSWAKFPSVAEYDMAAKARNWPASRQFYRKQRFRSWLYVRARPSR